jgi:hypothetical protein
LTQWSLSATYDLKRFGNDRLGNRQVSPDLEASFVALLDEWVPQNQDFLARSAGQLVGAGLAADAARVRRAVLEPLVVAWLTSPTPQIDLASLLPSALAPRPEALDLRVVADDDGVVELPGLGQFGGSAAGERLRLRWSGGDRVTVQPDVASRGGTDVVLGAIPMVPGTHAVLAMTAHPLLKRFYCAASSDPPAMVEPSIVTQRYAQGVAEAFSLLSRTVPKLYGQLAQVIRRVTVHRAGVVHSFATPAAHGAVFLAADEQASEVGFVEDVVHQGGHVLCAAMTVDRDVMFKVSAETPLADIIGEADETRSLYEAFHGVFTEAAMIFTLHRLLDLPDLRPRQTHEARGRLGLISSRAVADLANICRPGLFTAEGIRILEACRAALIETIERRRNELTAIDLTGQPYAFSYAAFEERNPLDRARS